MKPALGDPRCGSNAFRFCVSSATRESSQGQVVPRFRASLLAARLRSILTNFISRVDLHHRRIIFRRWTRISHTFLLLSSLEEARSNAMFNDIEYFVYVMIIHARRIELLLFR